MKLSLENTEHVVTIDGVTCRIWQGKSASGIEAVAFIHKIVPATEGDRAEFDRELLECAPIAIGFLLRSHDGH